MSRDAFTAEPEAAYPFLNELVGLRRRARGHIQAIEGRAPEAGADQSVVLQLLHEALAAERACVARYRGHARLGMLVAPIRDEFLRHAQEEQGHAERIVERIVQLGGQPDAAGSGPGAVAVDATHAELDAEAVVEVLEEDLIAERIAIECYREIAQFVAKRDAQTFELLTGILALESGHAREIAAIRAELMGRDRQSGATSTTLPRLDLQCA